MPEWVSSKTGILWRALFSSSPRRIIYSSFLTGSSAPAARISVGGSKVLATSGRNPSSIRCTKPETRLCKREQLKWNLPANSNACAFLRRSTNVRACRFMRLKQYTEHGTGSIITGYRSVIPTPRCYNRYILRLDMNLPIREITMTYR
jgi:hypothetical protein